MDYIMLNLNDEEIVFEKSEFLSYISKTVYEAFVKYTKLGKAEFENNLLYNWNSYSPQSEDQCCMIVKILDYYDLPRRVFYYDINISRLKFLGYALRHYDSSEYLRVCRAVQSRIAANKIQVIDDLYSQNQIQEQIELIENYKSDMLNAARIKYANVLAALKRK